MTTTVYSIGEPNQYPGSGGYTPTEFIVSYPEASYRSTEWWKVFQILASSSFYTNKKITKKDSIELIKIVDAIFDYLKND